MKQSRIIHACLFANCNTCRQWIITLRCKVLLAIMFTIILIYGGGYGKLFLTHVSWCSKADVKHFQIERLPSRDRHLCQALHIHKNIVNFKWPLITSLVDVILGDKIYFRIELEIWWSVKMSRSIAGMLFIRRLNHLQETSDAKRIINVPSRSLSLVLCWKTVTSRTRKVINNNNHRHSGQDYS